MFIQTCDTQVEAHGQVVQGLFLCPSEAVDNCWGQGGVILGQDLDKLMVSPTLMKQKWLL